MHLLDPSYTMTTTTKKRDYIWMLDLLPGLALGQFCSKWLLTVFHSSPEASSWVATISFALGGGVGFVLSQYLRIKATENIQNIRPAFIVSLSVSLVLALAIVTVTVLLIKPREVSYEDAIKRGQELSYTEATDRLATPSTTFQKTKALAEQGDANEQVNLGVAYFAGQGVVRNDQEGVKWLRLSAAQGNSLAQSNLGTSYAEGRGVPQDYQEALKWYRLSAAQGNYIAQSNLGMHYEYGEGVPQDYVQAMTWYRKAADQGDTDAQTRLGTMYAFGHGVPQDYVQALMWYLIAKAKGSTLPDQNLQKLKSLSTPAQIAEAQRMAREWWAAHPQKN
jgi:hypothetical protein